MTDRGLLLRWLGSAALISVAVLFAGTSDGGCGGGGARTISSVQLQTTSLNPKVGETVHVGATAVDSGGVSVTDATCKFASSAPAIASVDETNGTVTANSGGQATITATCSNASSHAAAQVTITVRDCRCLCEDGTECHTAQKPDCGVDQNGIPNVCGCPASC